MRTIRQMTAAFLATVFVITITTFASFAASGFEGKWKVKDTAGQDFEITLSADGTAKASRGEGMTGTGRQQCRGDHVEYGLDDQDRQGRRRLQEDGLQQGPAARRSADQQLGCAKGELV